MKVKVSKQEKRNILLVFYHFRKKEFCIKDLENELGYSHSVAHDIIQKLRKLDLVTMNPKERPDGKMVKYYKFKENLTEEKINSILNGSIAE